MLSFPEALQETCDRKHNFQSRVQNIENWMRQDRQEIAKLRADIDVINARYAQRAKEKKQVLALYKKACAESIKIQQEIMDAL